MRVQSKRRSEIKNRTASRSPKKFQVNTKSLTKIDSKRIIINDRVYLPASSTSMALLKKNYEFNFYNEADCAKCDNKPERPNAICQGCPSYSGLIRLWAHKHLKSGDYISLPAGNFKRIQDVFKVDLLKARDKRPLVPFSYNLKWRGKLRKGEVVNGIKSANQVKLVQAWLKKKNGLIIAPPRTGKTVLGIRIACKLKVKTLIIAHKKDLLDNFYKTIYGDPSKDKPAMTNALQIERKGKGPVAIIAENLEDIRRKDPDIVAVTYQKFIREDNAAKKIRKFLRNRFSLLIVDEVHMANSECFSKFVNRLNIRYKLGLTATKLRKDKLDVLVENIMGPEVIRSKSTSMIPKIVPWVTGITPPRNYQMWHHAMNFLVDNENRNRMIVQQVFKDLRTANTGVIIAVDYRKHMENLVFMLNRQAKVNRMKRKEDWPKDFAVGFHSGCNRKEVLEGIDFGKHKVVVAIRSMMKQGIDMDAPSYLYSIIPTSGDKQSALVGAPMFQQLAYRPSTPAPNKPQPIVRVMVDNMGISIGCYKSLFSKEIKPRLKKTDNWDKMYRMSKRGYNTSMAILQGRPVEEWENGETLADMLEIGKKKKYVPKVGLW